MNNRGLAPRGGLGRRLSRARHKSGHFIYPCNRLLIVSQFDARELCCLMFTASPEDGSGHKLANSLESGLRNPCISCTSHSGTNEDKIGVLEKDSTRCVITKEWNAETRVYWDCSGLELPQQHSKRGRVRNISWADGIALAVQH
jgi:hypothetical protein